ncbi:site-specific integrase [Sphingobacterium yanglingense]|uniref:Site-specific recombinase XerD n=1 Tax=Sphingobacterium yanglingense TaxID=1437280 RepID=A0A4R6W8A3_9SPHI|nr:tyrosine-type recombinase/integrase [Sphingobacterium yanglingense]TDQ73846.1 site-specific recombinase XerD [Sphingobacterium yanglingense]
MKLHSGMRVLPFLHKSKSRDVDGKSPVVIRITICGLRREVHIGEFISVENWDVKEKTVSKVEPNYRQINSKIFATVGILEGIYQQLLTEKKEATSLLVKQYYENLYSAKENFDVKQSNKDGGSQLLLNQKLTDYTFYSGSVLASPISENANTSEHLKQENENLISRVSHLENKIENLVDTVKELLKSDNKAKIIDEDDTEGLDPEIVKTIAKNKNLISCYNAFIEKFKLLVDNGNRSDGTYRQHKTTRNKISEFLKTKYELDDIKFKNIMPTLAEEFYDFLTLEADSILSDVTAKKHVKKLKQVVQIAVKKQVIPTSPISHFVCGGESKIVIPLELSQIDKICNTDFKSNRLNEVRDAYIAQIFTGFAYQDLYNLTEENIVKVGQKGERWLQKHRGKTNVLEVVPILPIVENLIEKYKAHNCRKVLGQLVPVNSNAKYNEYLKEIGTLCGIENEMNTHLARHTFADLMLNMGMPLEDVSKMLGHKSIRTTQRYCRVNKGRIAKNIAPIKNTLFNINGQLNLDAVDNYAVTETA